MQVNSVFLVVAVKYAIWLPDKAFCQKFDGVYFVLKRVRKSLKKKKN